MTSLLRKSQRKTHKLAYYDSLTGLANEAVSMYALMSLLHKTPEHRYAIIDIYNFKLINDSYGHDVGIA